MNSNYSLLANNRNNDTKINNMTAKEYILKKIGRNNNSNSNKNNNGNSNNSNDNKINSFDNSLGIQMLNKSYTNTLPKLDVEYNRVIRNTKPLLSTAVNDIASERYKKFIETCVSIDSRDRLSGNPNNYKIYLK